MSDVDNMRMTYIHTYLYTINGLLLQLFLTFIFGTLIYAKLNESLCYSQRNDYLS